MAGSNLASLRVWCLCIVPASKGILDIRRILDCVRQLSWKTLHSDACLGAASQGSERQQVHSTYCVSASMHSELVAQELGELIRLGAMKVWYLTGPPGVRFRSSRAAPGWQGSGGSAQAQRWCCSGGQRRAGGPCFRVLGKPTCHLAVPMPARPRPRRGLERVEPGELAQQAWKCCRSTWLWRPLTHGWTQ